MLVRYLILFCAVALTGCGQETLYSRLDEREANEMLAVLLSNGIDARKVGLGDSLELTTKRRDLPVAIALLSERGYPRQDFESLGEVFKREGFVSSPLEERARLLYALSQELAETLSAIDGVVTARVHLAIPEQRVLSDEIKPSSASIFVKHRPGSPVAEQAALIKALVVNSIEGLPYDNVTVTFFPASRIARNSGG
ncbi:MAG: type III secretion system inner membrane ring lipoprotein SctJ [Woeseiaceae bacterium]